MEVSQRDYFGLLSTETICQVFRSLEGRDLAVAECVCKVFQAIINHPQELEGLYADKFYLPRTLPLKNRVEMAQVIKGCTKAGLKRINPYLYKANSRMYMYIQDGRFDVLKRIPIGPKNGKPLKVAPDGSAWRFKVLMGFSGYRQIYSLHLDGTTNPIFDRRVSPYIPLDAQIAGTQAFVENGYTELGNCLDRFQKILIKNICVDDRPPMVAAFFIKDDQFKFFRTTFCKHQAFLQNNQILNVEKNAKDELALVCQNSTDRSVIKFTRSGRDVIVTVEKLKSGNQSP